MRVIDYPSYLQLRDNAEVLEADGHGDKVLRLRDGTFLKLFRRKRLISSAALFPYAERFARNASELARRDIVCPKVLDVLRIPQIQRDAVHYEPLPGQTLRQLDRNDPAHGDEVRTQLGELIATLHARGVYFRSLHLGNVVRTPEGRMGLIDIADLRVQRSALGATQRIRNFKHLLRYEQDRTWFLDDSEHLVLKAYLRSSQVHWTLEQLLKQLQLD
ncbi:toluene tolerance protein [Pseudomonas paraeruginosa]|uniref:toluene tolerance protein n=1 Tax=Pseudomonas aeruginosa group TaxID=136841 RepID=UPI00053D1109|nr:MULTISPECIES: toluene tolerance protein [Pseudomonas aeruginosa group]KAB0748037.1 toluene tolerance protein [Pseudomonas aeruginosa]MBG4068857.1 toluene tolerance protein [Pseudomonas aeruginosa]MBG5600459.1 toluene tolerance protein [Pseudomonas aeruginosa]MBH3673078.1 toluene tolerance protein [Pseudomonas aeruginosa]MBH9433623.1 toluene tolerance protein [Pseudomonas aeruginosa]